jgi:predicted nucleotidyltransferase
MESMTTMDDGAIREAVNRLLRAAPGSRVILFGSRARGDARSDSDVDFLVIEPKVDDRYLEMERLARLLGEHLVPADIVVQSQEMYDRWRETPNTLAWRASREGKVYDRAA